MDFTDLRRNLNELQKIVDQRDGDRLILLLKRLIPDYSPSAQLLKTASSTHSFQNGAVVKEVQARNNDHSRVSVALAPTPEIS